MRYILVALMATILGLMAGHTQQRPVKVISITNGQQLLVQVEAHGRAVRLACLQAPRFRQEPWAEFAQSVLESHVKRGDQAKFEHRSRDCVWTFGWTPVCEWQRYWRSACAVGERDGLGWLCGSL